MRFAIASDHRGIGLKQRVAQLLTDSGHVANDLGPTSLEAVDYPDYAALVAEEVKSHDADRGILICSSGIGMSLAANKFPGIRAALCWNPTVAEFSRRHNDANILCLAADHVDLETNLRIVRAWLEADFEAGRHARRVAKIHELEVACAPESRADSLDLGSGP